MKKRLINHNITVPADHQATIIPQPGKSSLYCPSTLVASQLAAIVIFPLLIVTPVGANQLDAPEEGELFFEEACQFLTELTLGKTARIEFAGRRRDKYGRLLGYLYIDSIFVNKAILENGLGYLYLFKDTELDRPETEELFRAQRAAMQKGIGLWSVERAQEDYYLAAQGSFRFHRPGCRSVKGLQPGRYRTFNTREEALYEGLSPCRRCKP